MSVRLAYKNAGLMFRVFITVLWSLLAISPAFAQDSSQTLLDQLAGLIDRGELHVDVALQEGRIAAAPGWTVQVVGSPQAMLVTQADGGRVRRVVMDVRDGQLLVDGSGLRPDLVIERISFEEGKGVSEARVRGRGVWRPIVAVFRTLAKPALRRLDVPTDIGAILRGQILNSEKSDEPTPPFLDLVREVHIHDTEFVAFAGYPVIFGDMVELRTAEHPTTAPRAAIDNATFQPPRNDQPARFEVDGRIEGEIENGSVAFVGSRCAFSRGALEKGAFRVSSDKEGQPQTSFSAEGLAIDLTSGEFRWPGGPKVGVEAPSRFAVRKLHVRPDGSYSGTVDAALFGKVGAIDRAGITLAASDVTMSTKGATVVDGRATGDVKLDFQYRLDHTLNIHYPVEELRARSVPIAFQGSFAADLHFENAGAGDEGVVTGTYQFTVPWRPVEEAAFQVLRAKWSQDVPPAIRKVQFEIEPRRFGPCGPDCFLLDLEVTAAKTKKKGYLFQQVCDSEGRANMVVDTESRSLQLRNVRVEPRCRGVVGSVLNFIAPFLTKSYSDVTLLQMPADLPFSIDSIGSGKDAITIAGKMAWAAR